MSNADAFNLDVLEAPEAATAAGPVPIIEAATSLMNEFRHAVDSIASAGEEGAAKKVCDAFADVLKAVAERIRTA